MKHYAHLFIALAGAPLFATIDVITQTPGKETEEYFLSLKGAYEQLTGKYQEASHTYHHLATLTPLSAGLTHAQIKLDFQQSRFDRVCQNASCINPTNSAHKEIAFLLGQAYLFCLNHTAALSVFQTLQKKHPLDDRFDYFCILTLMRMQRWHDALRETEKTITQTGKQHKRFLFLFLKSKILFAQNNLEKALETCNQSLALNPQFWKGELLKGSILEGLGRDTAARTCYETYCAHTHDAQVMDKVIALSLKIGDLDRARTLLETHKKDTAAYHYDHALLLFKSKEFKKAEQAIAKSLKKDQRYHQAHRLAIHLALAQGSINGIIASYTNWLTHEPNNSEIIHEILGLRKGKLPLRFVKKILHESSEIAPSPLLCFARGDLLHEQKEYAAARNAYHHALELFDHDANPLMASKLFFQIACTQYAEHDSTAARISATSAIGHSIVYPSAHNLYALLLISEGLSSSDAAAAVHKALAADPENPAYLDTLGQVYAQQMQWGKARACYDNALLKSPNNQIVYEHLTQLPTS